MSKAIACAAALFLGAHAHPQDDPDPAFEGFPLWWTSELSEFNETEVSVDGSLPSWLRGTFYRNGPGRLEFPKRSVTQYFDGLAKLYKFRMDGSKVHYATKFLKSKQYKQSMEEQDIRGKMSLFPLDPAPSFLERMKRVVSDYADNTNINVWKTGDHLYTTTDASICTEIDPVTLDTKGYGPPIDGVDWSKAGMSAAHPARTRDGGTVNYFINPAQIFGHTLEMYVDTPDMKRRILGSTTAPYLTTVHSFAVTDNYAVLFYYPMEVEISKYMTDQTDHLSGTMVWNAERNTTVYIFDLRKTNAAPQITTTVPFYAMHQINAYEKEDANGDVQLNIDMLAYENGAFMMANETFGTLPVFRDVHRMKDYLKHPSFAPAKPTRINIELASGKVSFTPHEIKDKNGQDIVCELPRINDAYRGKESCIFYAFCSIRLDIRAQIGKINLCTGNNELYYTEAAYPDEPVFVGNPAGKTEDEGVILMTKLDGVKKKTFLQVVDAQTLNETARIYAPVHHTAGIHAAFFFDKAETFNIIV